ncbi:MAG: YtxH domain-containing protein [Parachlamydiaceae bacterium]
MTKLKNVATGAALGTLLGSIALALYSKRVEILEVWLEHTHQLGDKTRERQDHLVGGNKKEGACHLHLTGMAGVFFGEHNRDANNQLYLAGLIGVILGAGIGLILAPQSGKELRAQIREACHTLVDKKIEELFRCLKAHQQEAQETSSNQESEVKE